MAWVKLLTQSPLNSLITPILREIVTSIRMWYSLLTMVMDLTHGATQDVKEDRTPEEYNNLSL